MPWHVSCLKKYMGTKKKFSYSISYGLDMKKRSQQTKFLSVSVVIIIDAFEMQDRPNLLSLWF